VTLRFGIASALMLALALALPFHALAATKHQRSWTFTFAADTLGNAPTNSVRFGGAWEVVVDSSRVAGDSALSDTAAALPRVLRQSEDDDGIKFHYIQFPKPSLKDQVVSVRFRILDGEIDPTAGVMLQVDPKGRNGYIVRYSGASGEVIAHYLIYGKRRDLHFCKVEKLEANTWHTLETERVGFTMIVRLDGEEKFRIRDERFTNGSAGLWTEDDTIVDFEQLKVSMR
jgi:hypothetical protein